MPRAAGAIPFWWSAIATCWLLVFPNRGLGQVAVASISSQLPLLTTVQQVQDLTSADAGRRYPVKLRGQVIGRLVGLTCIIQDETGAIPVFREGTTKILWPGQVVELEGVSDPGLFSQKVLGQTVRVVAEAPLPTPVLLTEKDLAFGKARAVYGEIRGIVRSADWHSSDNILEMQLAFGASRLQVFIYEAANPNNLRLVDSEVRLRGVVSSRFNQLRQWLGSRFNVTGLTNVFIERPPLADPFDCPLESLHNLAHSVSTRPGTPFSSGHRVKVRGQVTHQVLGKLLFIRDEGQGLQVHTSQRQQFNVGETVEVVGFPAAGVYAPILEDALCRKTGVASEIMPVPRTAKTLLGGICEADLVTLDAQVLGVDHHHGGEDVLVLQEAGASFNAILRTGRAAYPALPGLRPGCRVRLTGICQIHEVTERMTLDSPVCYPASFRLLLRSPEDVAVLQQPPWWTPMRLAGALGAVTLVLLAAVGWIALLRQRVHRQTEVIREQIQQGAALEERARIARELHDTLEQDLAGVAMQLDAAAFKLQQSPSLAGRALDMARQMVRHCRQEARHSVWELRCQALEAGDLALALEETLSRIVDGQSVKLRCRVEGRVVRLPSSFEHDLLRIGQEAVANAVKHGRPTQVETVLAFEPGQVRLAVSDDGCGFNPESPGLVSSGRFGLCGMRERAAKLGGQLLVKSQPGRGTSVEAVVPTKLPSSLTHETR